MSKQRLTENFSKDWQEPLVIRKLSLQESFKIVEAEGKQFPILEKWEVPVWRLGKKNLNGRTYRESLGRKIEKECKEVVTANLADHPEEDGSVKDILSVSKNPHVRDGILYVDAYIVDENFEKKLNKMVEAGYGLGVSSSVLGELDEDNNVIDDSVELERFFDYVISPSYQVYVTKDSKQITENQSIEKNVTINNIEETYIMSDKLKMLTEKTTRLNLEKILEEADKKSTISEKIAAIEEALSFTSDEFLPDMHASISAKLEALKKESLDLAEKGLSVPKLEESLATKESEKASIEENVANLTKELNDLKEKYELATTLLDEAKEYSIKAESLIEIANAEKGSRFTTEEFKEIVDLNESLSSTKDKLLLENKKYKDINKKLSEEKLTLESKVSSLRKKIKNLESVIASYDQEVADGLMNEEEPIVDTDEYAVAANDAFDYSDYGPESMPSDDEVDLDITNDDEVEDYYESLISENPNYKVIKEDILKCKTIVEAQRTAIRLSSLVEKKNPRASAHSDSRMNESVREIDTRKLLPKGWL
jgi:hypothetical protein